MFLFNRAFLLSLFFVVFSGPAVAGQLGDVTLPDTVTLEGTDTGLQLNGMGYRKKFIIKVYVAGLYTESKVRSRDEVQALDGPKRIVMHMVYDEVSRKKMAAAWNEGFEENTTDEQLSKLQKRLQQFISWFPDLKESDVIFLDYLPGTGTRLTINGENKGVIQGSDFYVTLLDVWLGEEPADDNLKDALLGMDE